MEDHDTNNLPPQNPDGTFNIDALHVTEAQRLRIAQLPQGTEDWLKNRRWRLTASNFGAAAGHHLPGARGKLLQVYFFSGNCFMFSFSKLYMHMDLDLNL